MPMPLTYPGVYIEELSSGVRTIAGVATSIATFVGWAPKGPSKRAVRIQSFSDYERHYGPIYASSYLGYSVKQFFDNGGTDAYILRLANEATDTTGEIEIGGMKIKASSPGAWSKQYGVSIKSREGRFSLIVSQFRIVADGSIDTSQFTEVEAFNNLSTDPRDPRFVKEVINDEVRGSLLISIDAVDNNPPQDQPSPAALDGGSETPPEDINDINLALWTNAVLTAAEKDGVLDKIDLFNILCVPGLTDPEALSKLLTFCRSRRAFLIADCDPDAKLQQLQIGPPVKGEATYGAFYFPWLIAQDPLSEGRLSDFPPCGFMAGLYARTDAQRGVWKAPAGTEARIVGVNRPKEPMTDNENGTLNVKGINCIRAFAAYGTVAWGARTLDGNDEIGSEWKYIPVRRIALFIEESLFRGSKWAVFEPNDEPLWSQLRLNIGAFMHDLFRQGAFQGRTPRDAYFVKCDSETTTQNDINRGIVNIIVGFAPLKPAEFVVIKLTQIAGQIEA